MSRTEGIAAASAPEQPSIPIGMRFVLGGMAGMGATCFTQPLDLVKNRMQMSGEGGKSREHKTSFHATRNILRAEGLTGIYNGLSAGLLKQASYTTVRMGVFSTLTLNFTREGQPPGFLAKIGMGMTAGAVGAFVGTPAEVALVRMTSDGRLPIGERREYKHVLDALVRITREEGFAILYRGCLPTIGRAMVLNGAQLGTYSQAKQSLLNTVYFKDNLLCHFVASMISGLATATSSLPFDIIKTRLQNMPTVNGVPQYSGAFDVISKLIKTEGFFSFWKGFTPYYVRLGPHTVLTFVFLEQLNARYINYMATVGGVTYRNKLCF